MPTHAPASLVLPVARPSLRARPWSRALAAFALALAALALVAPPLEAGGSVPPVVPGFPNNLSCTPGQLLYRQIDLGRVTNIIYHNGRLYSNNVAGSDPREWLFTDPADPSTLTIVNTQNLPSLTDHGTHGHGKAGDWAGGVFYEIRRVSPGVNSIEPMPPEDQFFLSQPSPPDSGMHWVYYPWAMPFNWLQYGPTPASARLYRADQLLAEWEPLADHGVAGNSILLGNLLILTSDASMLGVAVYDIGPTFETPPRDPAMLDRFTGAVGAYIGMVWESYLVLTGGADRDLMHVIDYSEPTDLQLVATLDLSGNPAVDAGTNVPYVQTQDQYVYVRRHKIDMESLSPVLELDEVGDNRPAGSVGGPLDISQYTLPLGNLLVSGSYSFSGRDGVGVWCHDSQPDRRSPYVGYHVPRPGQTQFPLGAPISLVIAETLESYTIINGETILLRPVGGAAVDAWTSFSHDGILTLTPKQYLQPNTTYEAVVVEDGIRDAANNGIEGYSFTFSTGSNVAGGNASPEITSFDATPAPATPGQTVDFLAVARQVPPSSSRASSATMPFGSIQGVGSPRAAMPPGMVPPPIPAVPFAARGSPASHQNRGSKRRLGGRASPPLRKTARDCRIDDGSRPSLSPFEIRPLPPPSRREPAGLAAHISKGEVMSRFRAASLVVLLSCLAPAFAMAADNNSTGSGTNSYVELCDVPFPDIFKYYYHFASYGSFTLNDAIKKCQDKAKPPTKLPYNWRTANFMIHGFGTSPHTTTTNNFTCLACVRYEHKPWDDGDPMDIYALAPRPIDISIADAIALFGGRVSRVELLPSIDSEAGEMAGGYHVTLVNVDTGLAGVVRIDPFTGEATVVREEPIDEGQ
ncbi:MAG: Ig-like domain-containing protein [Holophagales bacterium]|nr:Ig-like domain-containing protein [Holophagales bacterium]